MCECRFHAEELDTNNEPIPNRSRTGYIHELRGIGCKGRSERSTVDDRGVRWWFCDFCAPPVVDTEWYRRVMDPQSVQPPYEAWNEQCWVCICPCSECRGGF